MSVEVLKLRPGVKIRTKDGADLYVHGSYMSETGLVITAKADRSGIVERNVPFDQISEIVEG